jgi:fucose 4-O-acetylase-like acetyltransferase
MRVYPLAREGWVITSFDSVTTADTLQTNNTECGQRQAQQQVRRQVESVDPTRPRVRDPFFDNAKFLLVILVVIGHNWYPLIGTSRAVKTAYLVLYTFHMPAFIMLSGYFSRGFEARPDQVRKLIKSVLVPYLIFETCYLAVVAWADGHAFRLDLTYPSYLCWFLIALFVWRLTTPVWRAVPQPVVLAVLVSLLSGLNSVTSDLAFSRVFQFLPWFVVGLFLRPEHFRRLRRRSVRLWAAALVVTALPVAYVLAPRADADWLSMEFADSDLHVGPVEYLAIRIALLAASALMVAATLALVPARRLWLTALGTATMYPYLLHGLIVKYAQAKGLYTIVANSGPPAVISLTVGAIALALLLSTPPVRRVTRWAVEPRFSRS